MAYDILNVIGNPEDDLEIRIALQKHWDGLSGLITESKSSTVARLSRQPKRSRPSTFG